MKPNIFSIATRELFQDGFFTWLLQWADRGNELYDKELHAAAQDLIRFLIKQQHNSTELDIDTVKTWRQWKHIDIIAEVNQDFVIVIEDKTNTSHHSDQLSRYKQTISEYYAGKDKKIVYIYLKTGNESVETLNAAEENGFAIVNRNDILNIFNQHNIENQIFIEFKEYLSEIERQTNSYETLESIKASRKATEGFYVKLQGFKDGDWEYVSNPTGGLLAFWYFLRKINGHNIYIQIEIAIDQYARVVIKVSDHPSDVSALYHLLDHLQSIASKYNLEVTKPSRFRAGATSTVAIVKNAFPIDNEGKLDFEKFLVTLNSLEGVLEDLSGQQSITN